MMANPKQPAALLPFASEGIPEALRAIPRWAPWRAVWNDKRQKYDKIPYRADAPQYGLSTARPDKWFTFQRAIDCYNANPGMFAGLGIVLTGLKGYVGTDLDNCIADGVIAPWAKQVVADLASYTETSPSGKGLRVFNLGAQEDDWNNHDVGIEVYGGNDARFLTVSGQHLADTPFDVVAAPAGVLAGMQSQYAKEKTKATIIDLNMPEVLPEDDLPDVADLEIPAPAKDFLTEGIARNDRSGELHAAAVALYATGLDHQVVFSILVNNAYAMGTALDHRRQDPDRAMHYLWREQCLKGKPKAQSRVASADDFDDVSEPAAPGASVKPPKKRRFEFQQAAEYLNRASVSWLVKRVLPKAEIGAMFGESGSGKSFLILDMAMAVAGGTPWMGHEVAQGAVAYVCAEGAGGFTVRLKAYADHYLTDLATLPIHVLGDAPSLLAADDVRDLIASLKALGPLQMVIIDTLAQVTAGGNENSGEDMGQALGHCKKISKAINSLVMLVAHSGKNAERGLRGWSGIKGALDVEILVERSDKYHSATITKMKDGAGEGDEYPFTLESVTVGQDEDGDDVTSCIVKAGNLIPKSQRQGKPKGVWQQTVLQVAQTLTDLAGPPTVGELLASAVNEMPHDEGKRDRRRNLATQALEGLVAAKRISTTGGTVNVL